MELPDLTSLTLAQVFALLAVVAAFDVLGTMIAAIVQGVFTLEAVARWLQTHVLARAFPIFALAVFGHGIPVLEVPAIPAAYGLALAGLAAYVLETVASIRSSLSDASA